MLNFQDPIVPAAIFSLVVLVIFWFEYRKLRASLLEREEQMRRRMYELSILRELGERIGYSLNVQKIVDIISSSLGSLLPYSTVAYMMPVESGRLTYHTTLAESVSKVFISDVRSRMLKAWQVIFGKNYLDADIDETVTGLVTDPQNAKKVQSFFNIPIVINGKPLEQAIPMPQLAAVVQEPFQVTNTQGRFSVVAKVTGGGVSSQADAIRHGIARALVELDETLKPVLRKAGLMTRDPRVKERKKYGLKRARKAPQYTKR